MDDLVRKVTSIDVPEGTSVTFTKKRQHDFGSFQAIGLLSTDNHHSKYDVLEVFETLSRKCQELFNYLKRQRDEYGRIACPRQLPVGTSEYKQLMRCVGCLVKAELLVQVKVTQYHLIGFSRKDFNSNTHKVFILNPNFIRSRFQGDAMHFWKSIINDNKS